MDDRGLDTGGARAPDDGAPWDALAAMRRGLGLSGLAVLVGDGAGTCTLAMRDAADETGLLPPGARLADLGAAAGAWRSRQAVVLNQDAPRALPVPYATRPRVLGGATAFPVDGGLAWADRADGPLAPDRIAALHAAGRLLDALAARAREARRAAARAEGLTATVEGVRAILAGASEREAVAALADAAGRQARAGLALVVLFGDEPGTAMVVGGSGAAAREAVGRTFAAHEGMVGLAVRSGVVVPPGGRYQAPMGPVLSPGIPVPVRAGDPLAVLLLGGPEDPVGALVQVGGPTGEPLHGLRTLADTAALLIRQFRLRERVARDAMFDALTGLYNRRAMAVRLAETFAAARRHGHPLGFVMLDADHFKAINDRHGHPVGDRVLRVTADVIRGCLRESDFAGRYGGEEFAVVLPNTDVEGARSLAERIRRQVGATAVALGDASVSVTVSAGVAAALAGMAGPQDLVAAADAALYEAKRAGRDRVVVSGREPGAGRDAGRRS